MTYLDEDPKSVITRCGQNCAGKECGERLQLNPSPQPEGAACYHAVCPSCGIVPIFPQMAKG